MDNTQLFRQFLSNKFKDGGKKYRDYRYNESTLPQADYIEQYLNTPVGTHIIDNPMYTDEDIASNNTPIIDSNTPVSEVVEDNVTVLPEVIVQGVSPQRKATARSLLNYSMNSQPEIANILVDSNAPTIIDKLAVLSKENTDRIATNIISDNIFETGGPFSQRMPAMPGLIIAQKLKKLFSREPEKKPRNAQTDRKKPNTSSTDKRSENIENQIYEFLPKDRSPYDIPFIPKKSILINGYTTSTNALDSLAKYAGIHNRTLQISEKPLQSKSKTRPVTKEEALGLSLRETKGGALPYSNDSRTSKDKEAKRAFYNANVFTAFQDIPATALVNDYHYNKTSQSIPPLLDAFQYYAQGDYNRGDSNHTADVKAAGKEAFQNPQVQRWWDTEGKYWFNGTYKNAGDDSGENSILQGELLNIGTQPVKLKANGGNLFYNGGDEDNIPNRLTYPIDAVRQLLYRNITPFGYNNPVSRVAGALANKQDEYRIDENSKIQKNDPNAVALDDIWATYLNIPENRRRIINKELGISKQPQGYYSFNNPNIILAQDIDYALGRNINASDKGLFEGERAQYMNGILGNYTIGKDYDSKGSYLYYSDSKLDTDNNPDIKTGWDINPFSRTVEDDTLETTESTGQYGQDLHSNIYRIGKAILGNIDDVSMGIGTPVPIYGKIYLDDIYGLPSTGAHYLPEIVVTASSKKELGGTLTHPTIEKDKYAHGGFKGNLYDGEGDSVNLMNVAADIGTDMIPIVGTLKDAYKFYQEPSLENAGWLAFSATTDLLPFLKPIKALKATKAVTKAAQAAEKAQIDIIRNEAKKAAEKVAKLRNTPNINPRKVRRAQDQYATYLNMIPERVPQGWAIDRAAEDAAFNYLLKYQMPKVGGDLIINTNQEMSDTLQKALGGPLFNSRTPIESFQGSKQLPIVRY